MFEDWKRAWREAVENFQRELNEGEAGDATTRAMRREVATARGAMGRLDEEIERARRGAASERDEAGVCRRREHLAQGIGDEETVRLAVEYAVRHEERAAVLDRKVEVLVAERELLQRDLERMEATLGERLAAGDAMTGVGPGPRTAPGPDPEAQERQERDFERMERDARERAAAERLEELKRKMR